MDSKILFSIIVPVYKVEKYIDQCVQSILKQDFKNFELILVDDGSPDNCGKICDEYAKKDDRVRVFHKENGGISDARNYGLKHAKGEYILFVDSDDFIFENSLEKIAEFLNDMDVDIVFLKGFKFFGENHLVEIDQDIKFEMNDSKDKKLFYISCMNKFPGSACGKVCKRTFLEINKLFFEKGLFSEDIEWLVRALKTANSIEALNVPYYYYRQNRFGSITNSVTSKNINSIVSIIKKHVVKSPEGVDVYINHFLAYEYIILLANYMSLSNEEKEKVNGNIFEYKWILKYYNNKKVKLVYYITKIFGVRCAAYLLSKFLAYKKKNNI